MKKLILTLFTIGLLINSSSYAQEYVQTTTNSAYANKNFSTTGALSLGFNGTNLPNGSMANLNSKTKWGNWMTFIDGFSNDGYVFHNPNNGGRMELINVDGATGSKKFGVFTVLKSGNIGMGTTNPLEKLHLNGSIRGNAAGGALRVKTAGGYLDLGAQNPAWAHIYTDRPKIIFNKDVYTTTNAFSSYNNDLILKTKGTERLRIDDQTGNAVFTNNLESKGTISGIKGVFDSNSLENNGWIPVSIGREYKTDRRTFEFVVDPTNTGSGYTAFAITDQSENLRHDFVSNNKHTWIDLDDHKGTHFFKVARGEYEPGKFATYIHMPRSESRIVIGQYGRYLEDKGYKLIVNNGGALVNGDFIANGNVGIGTTTPDAKLAVNGNIHAKEVTVDLVGWPDYVFEEDYTLPTLQQVEHHIKEKGHLINIPSATEVEEKGIQLGEMNKKLLEKIEELTLYTIAQEKKLKKQEDEIRQLKLYKNKIESLEKKINLLLNSK